MILQERIEGHDCLRCIVIGDELRVFRYDSRRPFMERHVTDDPPSSIPGDLAATQARTLTGALGYDIDTVEFAVRDGVLYAIDCLNAAPDFDSFSIKDDGFRWVLDRMCDLVLRYARGEADPPWRGAHRWGRFV